MTAYVCKAHTYKEEMEYQKDVISSRRSELCYCPICGAKGSVREDIVNHSEIIDFWVEQYHCRMCGCSEVIRYLEEDEIKSIQEDKGIKPKSLVDLLRDD